MRATLMMMTALLLCATGCSDKEEEDNLLTPEQLQRAGYDHILLTFPTLRSIAPNMPMKFQSKIETWCGLKKTSIEAIHMNTNEIMLSVPWFLWDGAEYEGEEVVNDSTSIFRSHYNAGVKIAGEWVDLRPHYTRIICGEDIGNWLLDGIRINDCFVELGRLNPDIVVMLTKDGTFHPYVPAKPPVKK